MLPPAGMRNLTDIALRDHEYSIRVTNGPAVVLPSPCSQLKQTKEKVLLLTRYQNQKARDRILQLHQHQQQDHLEGLVPFLLTLQTKTTSLLASPE